MKTWFESIVKYEKMQENGIQKKVSEHYMVDALSFTEAEAKTIEQVTPFISGDFQIKDISRSNISEIVYDESGDKWYRCKVNFVTLDEKSGAEKRTASYFLVQADSTDKANENVHTFMKDTLSDYEIEIIKETKIIDVYEN